MSTKRSKLEIVHDILDAIRQKNGRIKPTHLLYKSNLSHTKMKEYLGELAKNQMVEEEETKKGRFYLITEKGSMFLNEYQKIKAFSDTFGI